MIRRKRSGIVLRIFFWRDSDSFGKRLQIICVVVKAARLARLIDGTSLAQQRLGQSDPLGGDVFVDRRARVCLEDAADVGLTQEKVRRKTLKRQILPDVGVDIGEDFIYLCVVGRGLLLLRTLIRASAVKSVS